MGITFLLQAVDFTKKKDSFPMSGNAPRIARNNGAWDPWCVREEENERYSP